MNIRLFKPSLGEEELASIREAFERSWIGLGPSVQEFEKAWADYIGCRGALGLNSATAALHLAVQALRYEPGKKVMVPTITFSATAFAPVYNQLNPVFVDVDPVTLSISTDDMQRKYDKDVVAVIPVHFAGHPAAMDQILAFAADHKMDVIEDCAHTAGGEWNGKRLGTLGRLGCFSFEEKKCMTTGDGGMLCSDDEDLLNYIKPARWVGIDKDTWRRTADSENLERHWYYEIGVLGYKYNMNDLAASIGLAQLKKLPAMNSRRSELIRRYLNGLSALKGIEPLLPYEPERNVYHLFGIRAKRRDALIGYLKSRGIATGVHYVPLHTYPFFRPWSNHCPVAETLWEEFITLPLHAGLTDAEVDYVLEALAEAIRKGIC